MSRTAALPAGSPPVPAPGLSFATAVDLASLHRRNPAEAFLTGAVRTGPASFAAAALLPRSHPHYAGHTGPRRRRDPLLLLECARQAETYAAHVLYGVEADAHFVLRNWSATFAPDSSAAPARQLSAVDSIVDDVSARGAELLITAVTSNPRMVRDRLRALDYQLELWVDGDRVGQVWMEVSYLSHPAYTVLRARQHPGGLPSSAESVAGDGRPVSPDRVGRVRATDTVLLDVIAGSETVSARLRAPVENASLFDHQQDHIPAMVLVEAARQLAALATRHWGGAPPDRSRLTAMSSSFAAYAELTAPVELTATPAAGTAGSARPVVVSFRQAGSEIAQARLTMSDCAPDGSAPENCAPDESAPKRGATWPGLPS